MKLNYLLLLFLLSVVKFNVAVAAIDTTTPPYKKYPTLPAFEILLLDSATKFNSFYIQEGRYTMLMFFSTDCDHCQMMTDSLIRHMPAFKNVQMVMAAPQDLQQIRTFYQKNGLKKYRNILMGKDINMFFHKFYQAYYVPVIVIYDKQKKLLKCFEGGAKMKELLEVIK